MYLMKSRGQGSGLFCYKPKQSKGRNTLSSNVNLILQAFDPHMSTSYQTVELMVQYKSEKYLKISMTFVRLI